MKRGRRSSKGHQAGIEQKHASLALYPETLSKSADAEQGENLRNGLAKLILTVVRLLLEIIERQAYRAAMSGSLNEGEIERLGNSLIKIREELSYMLKKFGLSSRELDLAIGKIVDATSRDSRGNSNTLALSASSLVNLIDKIIEKETTIAGQVTISLAGIDLVIINLLATIQPARSVNSRSKEVDAC